MKISISIIKSSRIFCSPFLFPFEPTEISNDIRHHRRSNRATAAVCPTAAVLSGNKTTVRRRQIERGRLPRRHPAERFSPRGFDPGQNVLPHLKRFEAATPGVYFTPDQF
jgi:hypothetical protein